MKTNIPREIFTGHIRGFSRKMKVVLLRSRGGCSKCGRCSTDLQNISKMACRKAFLGAHLITMPQKHMCLDLSSCSFTVIKSQM